jgi:hypothetical protein
MRFRSKTGLALATVAAALGAFTSAASAQDLGDWEIAAVDPATFCREVQFSAEWEVVCVEAGTRKVIGTGATVAPYSRVTCTGTIARCNLPGVSVGQTGFLANPNFPPPQVLPGATIYHPGGVVGTAYAHGSSVELEIPNFCVGDPYYCPDGGLRVPIIIPDINTD